MVIPHESPLEPFEQAPDQPVAQLRASAEREPN
jgi:hypothetical protein